MLPFQNTRGYRAVAQVYFAAADHLRDEPPLTDADALGRLKSAMTALSDAGATLAQKGYDGIEPSRLALVALLELAQELNLPGSQTVATKIEAMLADEFRDSWQPLAICPDYREPPPHKFMNEGWATFVDHYRPHLDTVNLDGVYICDPSSQRATIAPMPQTGN